MRITSPPHGPYRPSSLSHIPSLLFTNGGAPRKLRLFCSGVYILSRLDFSAVILEYCAGFREVHLSVHWPYPSPAQNRLLSRLDREDPDTCRTVGPTHNVFRSYLRLSQIYNPMLWCLVRWESICQDWRGRSQPE